MHEITNTLTDPRFRRLRETLLPAVEIGEAAETDDAAMGDPGRIQAAVAILLREGDDLEVLLIKRAEAAGDPWSGQMALPGGRKDASDPSLLRTAIRETDEEVSVALDLQGVLLGRLAPTVPGTNRLPPITIVPHVFGVPRDTLARAASPEVDEVHWIPISVLQDPDTEGEVEIHYGDNSSRTFPCWRVGTRVIWGLTYRILRGFLEHLGPSRR